MNAFFILQSYIERTLMYSPMLVRKIRKQNSQSLSSYKSKSSSLRSVAQKKQIQDYKKKALIKSNTTQEKNESVPVTSDWNRTTQYEKKETVG